MGVVPRTKLPEILKTITAIGLRHDISIVNVFHAGDGNLHPILLFDERDAEQVARVMKASEEILDACLAAGGSVTGEHGIGVEKIGFMNKMFKPGDLAAMARLRDAFNPNNRLSPSKLLPTAGRLRVGTKSPATTCRNVVGPPSERRSTYLLRKTLRTNELSRNRLWTLRIIRIP